MLSFKRRFLVISTAVARFNWTRLEAWRQVFGSIRQKLLLCFVRMNECVLLALALSEKDPPERKSTIEILKCVESRLPTSYRIHNTSHHAFCSGYRNPTNDTFKNCCKHYYYFMRKQEANDKIMLELYDDVMMVNRGYNISAHDLSHTHRYMQCTLLISRFWGHIHISHCTNVAATSFPMHDFSAQLIPHPFRPGRPTTHTTTTAVVQSVSSIPFLSLLYEVSEWRIAGFFSFSTPKKDLRSRSTSVPKKFFFWACDRPKDQDSLTSTEARQHNLQKFIRSKVWEWHATPISSQRGVCAMQCQGRN